MQGGWYTVEFIQQQRLQLTNVFITVECRVRLPSLSPLNEEDLLVCAGMCF